jgi:hypothetical protein
VSNEKVIIEGLIGKDLEESGRGLILRYYPGIFWKGLRKTTKYLSEKRWCSGKDFNPGPPQYEAGALTTQPRRSVIGL